MFETPVHWVQEIVPHRVGLMARPRGGDSLADEVAAWRAASINTVVSLLEPNEVRELELKEEPPLCAANGIEFRHFPIPDRGVPRSARDVAALVAELHGQLSQGKVLAIHCRAGIGRTGLVAACLLHQLHVPRDNIFQLLSRSRGLAMPDTIAQTEWVQKYTGTFPGAQ